MISRSLLREARRRAALSQAELAGRASTTQSAIARIEGGRTVPTLERLIRLVRACGFDIDLRLVAHDSHEVTIVEGNLRLDPEERVAKMLAFSAIARQEEAAPLT